MKIILSFTMLMLTLTITAQNYWQDSRIPLSAERSDDAMYLPKEYKSKALNFEGLKNTLRSAKETSINQSGNIWVELPMPDGTIESFYTVESPVMEPGISARYPSIKTYKGISKDKTKITRFGIGPSGFHASIRTYDGEVYIDQVSKATGQYYVSYFVKNHGEPTDAHIRSCGTENSNAVPSEIRNPIGAANRGDDVSLHVYKMALACTGVWGRNRQTVTKALEDMVTSVNRLNQIYENELALKLVLIDNNDKLINLDPATDGYTNQNMGRELLSQNTSRVNTLLGGNSSYDIGHVYTNNCTDVGGVAALGSLCDNPRKAAGVTCHYSNLIYITVQVAAHEIGHQLSAQHTFNNCSDAQGNNENASLGNDFEPGSGSTIMSYGGLCGNNNVQGNNDDYYNNGSIVQVYNHTRDVISPARSCADILTTTNKAPDIKILDKSNKVVPKSTYFVLTGEATDANGDAMTYSWEGKDAGGKTCVYGEPTGDCPLFRSLSPKTVPYRFFPRESRIFSTSGDISEILPTTSRPLTFSFTVRDNNPEAGFSVWENLYLRADSTSGPFRVLTPAIGESFEPGEVVNVNWNVANTNNSIVNCQTVDIYVSLDKALHVSDPKMIPVALGVPNNGLASIILPLIAPSTQARIVVKAHDNVWFDINDFNFEIKTPSTPRAYYDLSKLRDVICLPGSTTTTISTTGLAGFTGDIKFVLEGLPQGITGSFSKNDFAVGQSTDITFTADNTVESGSYEWTILGISNNTDTLRRKFYIDVTSTNFDDLASVGPAEGLKDSPGFPIFSWSKSDNALEYQLQVATSPTFAANTLIHNVTTNDTFFITPVALDKNDIYYWRVKAANDCGDSDFTFIRSLGTANLSCTDYTGNAVPVNISATGSASVTSEIIVEGSGTISDINIKNIRLNHDFFKDLTATLKSPKGTEITIFTNTCANKYNMNVGFDDDGNNFFNCANGVLVFKPQNKLSLFQNEDPKGKWVFTIADTKSGNGGTFENITIEVCGSITSNPPVLEKNEIIKIKPNDKPIITTNTLLTTDADNSAVQLVYTLVDAPKYGNVSKNGVILKVGDIFTQEDINSGQLRYINTVTSDDDSFFFTVEDGNGGWVSITRFSIEISADFPSSTIDKDLDASVMITPNPASSSIDVKLLEKASRLSQLEIITIQGTTVYQQSILPGSQRINTSHLSSGIYMIRLTDGRQQVVRKLVIQH